MIIPEAYRPENLLGIRIPSLDVVLTLIDDLDYLTAMSAVISALMNIGPGFGLIGPSENFAFMSDATKWFLSWNMLVGRLEMFSALVVFYPSFWRS